MKNNNILIGVALTILIALMFVVMYVQQNTINGYKNLLEKADTTLTIMRDTIYFEKEIKDSLPKQTTQIIMVRDTVYRQVGDSIEQTPRIITLKKKSSPILL